VLRIYLDEDVDILLAQLLCSRGFACTFALQEHHLRWSDEQHIEWATSETRIVVTHNRLDFEALARQWWSQSKEHAGIVLAVRRANTYDLMRRLLPVLACYDQVGWRNVVMYA
jgi:hypothetical protein